jgi:conserved phage associated protein|nr:MAG TPA: protein of unknown function (DUF4815) [Caudoviricetes sp.]
MADLNKSPYFSDYDPQNNHHQVVYVAGHPIQARELNNQQAYEHAQRKHFAGHIFKDGSRVSGGNVQAITREYIRFATNDAAGAKFVPSAMPKSAKLIGKSSGVEAIMLNAIDGDDKDPPTMGLQYTKVGNDGQQFRFLPGEEIEIRDENDMVVKTAIARCPTCPGYLDPQDKIKPLDYKMKVIAIADGVFYYEGRFINVKASEIVYSKYGDAVTCKIGFDVIERIVTPTEDAQLFDNSLGYPNETAPGADRLVVELVLTKRTGAIEDGTKFIELATIEDGFLQVLKQDYQYAAIMDTMAQRTWEESGNYTVSEWTPRYREHKAAYEGDPHGFKVDGDESKLNVVISPGLGYVKGYRIETASDHSINVDKARSTLKAYDGATYFGEGCYIDLVPDPDLSVWPNSPQSQSIVDLTDIYLYDGLPNAQTPTGTIIGRIKVGDATYVGEKNGEHIWRYKILDSVITDKTKQVKCVANVTNRFVATIPTGTVFGWQNIADFEKALMFELPRNNMKSLRNIDRPDRSSMTITMRKKLTATLGADGSYTFTLSGMNFDANIKDTIIIVGNAGAYKSVRATADNCKPQGNSLLLNLGSEHSGKKVTIIHSVHTVGLIEKQKQSMLTYKRNVNKADVQTWLGLGKADVYQIVKIEAYSSATPNDKQVVTNKFEFDRNISHYAYHESRVKLREGEVLSNSVDKVDITFRYFNHTDSNAAGFFTIDSYSSPLADPDSGVTYKNLPAYRIGYRFVSAANILDFRPIEMSGENSVGEMPATGMTALYNMEYYVGRRDLLSVDKDGNFFHILGVPADDPKAPTNRNADVMPLYEVFIPAYTYSYQDVKLTRIENKRYTMRDIGRLETRIDNLEYYTSLSLLESSAAADDTKDAQGFSRFKNGFVCDDFKQYSTGDTANNEFRAIIDKTRGELRPYYYMFNRKGVFNPSKSKNAVITNGIIHKPYEHEKIDEQPYATRSLSVNPYIVARKTGSLILTPNVDTWSDTHRQPDMNMDIDTGVDAIKKLADRQNNMTTAFNNWVWANRTQEVGRDETTSLGNGMKVKTETTVKTVQSFRDRTTVSSSSSSVIQNRRRTTTTQTTQTNLRDTLESTVEQTTTTRTQTNASIESRTDKYTFDRVTDVGLLPYMRKTNIEFTASGLYPNMRHYVFFDKQDITELCTIQGSTEKIRDALVGNLLISDENGVLQGTISIPEGKFFTGVKEVRITNDRHNKQNDEDEVSYAAGQFFAGGIRQDKQNINLNVTTPVYKETEQVLSQERSPERTTNTRVTGTQVLGTSTTTSVRTTPYDPVAQSFKFDDNEFMISKIKLWFEAVQAKTVIKLQIRDMVNGYPGQTVLGEVSMQAANVKTSWNASEATEFIFPTPVRIQKGIEYCFVVLGETPATRIWISKLGETCVNVPNKVADSQIALGSSFRSQNASTWSAEQFEDIMYEIYAAKFDSNPMEVVFDVSGGLEEEPLDPAPFEGEQGSNLIRVYMKDDHGLNVGDSVHINCFPDQRYDVSLTNGFIHVGHYMEIDNQRSSAKVKSVKYRDSTHATVTVEKLNGMITPSSSFLATAFIAKPGSQDAFNAYFDIKPEDYDIRQAAGTFVNVETPLELNGIPLAEINTTHKVKRVDDNKTFIIEVQTSAAKSGRFGPEAAACICNRRADMFNASVNYQLHNAMEKWTYTACSHMIVGGNDGTAHDYLQLADAAFDMKADRYLSSPIKLATKTNEAERYRKEPSFTVKGVLTPPTVYLSPMLSADTMSCTFVANDIYPLDAESVNRDPNASGRFVPETDKSYGFQRFKYVTKTINLKNPAADLKIWFDMYRPIHAGFDIYIKLQKSTVTDIDDQEWIHVNLGAKGISEDINKFIEVEGLLSQTNPGLASAQDTFSAFKIKIVGLSTNVSIPPLFKNLRLIAYT